MIRAHIHIRRLRGHREVAAPVEFERADLIWATCTAAASAVLFATVLTSYPALGDAPETVAGVSSLGILHAPGYPSYVLAAHVFTLLVPIGSEAFKVNLFSLVCGALSVAAVQLLARRLGAPRWACALGALTLAASVVFWFYSGFAKHDMFSGLLFLLSLHLAFAWRARPTTGRLVALAAVIGVGLGSAWPLEVLVLPAVAFVLLAGRGDLHLRSLAASSATGLVVVVGVYGFVMIRAAQNPLVNWDRATTVGRLVALIDRADFTETEAPNVPSPGHVEGASPVANGPSTPPVGTIAPAPATVFARIPGAVGTFAREFGVLGLLLALLGLVVSLRWRRSSASIPLLIAFVAGALGAGIAVNFGAGNGSFGNDLMQADGEFGCYFVLACWLAVGAAEVVAGGVHLSGRLRAHSIRNLLPSGIAAALVAALLAPQVVNSWPKVHRAHGPYADRYAESAFALLPPRAAVFLSTMETTEPLIYRQVVQHQRPDVVVIDAGNLQFQWYRQEVERRLGIRLPPMSSPRSFVDEVRAVAAVRPVYFDAGGATTLPDGVGFRPLGLLSALATGRGLQTADSLGQAEARLDVALRQAGFPDRDWDIWPNQTVEQLQYSSAALLIAQSFLGRRDLIGAISALHDELRIRPADSGTRKFLSMFPGA